MKLLLLALPALLAPCCHYTPQPPVAVVDVSESRMTLSGRSYPVGTARRGVGNVPGTFKTPSDDLTVVDKWDDGDPRYQGRISGKKLWLAGPETPASRRIYLHRGKTSGNYSQGCIHLSTEHLAEVFSKLDIGSKVIIRP